MINKRSFTKYTIILQVFLILFAIATIPVNAAEAGEPILPLQLEGIVTINGDAAPVGTEITAKLGDKIVGTTTVDSVGVYGYSPSNRFLVTSDPEDYENLKFYVNGVETGIEDTAFENAVPDSTVVFNLVQTSAGGNEEAAKSLSGGSLGGYSESTDPETQSNLDGDDVPGSVSDKGTVSESTAFAGSEVEFGTTIDDVPSSEEESFLNTNGIYGGLLGLILVALVGIIFFVNNKNKE